MAISFDNTDNIRNIYRYDASANSYIGVAHSAATQTGVFDYFPEDATVGDYIAFGYDRSVWHDLTINVGTPLVATAITVVWEYLETGTTWKTLAVTDPSNTFQNAGSHTITFSVPPTVWNQTWPASTWAGIGGPVQNYSGCWIRCRITALTSLTEGGANSTSVPTCKDYAVKLDGANNYTLADVYNADVAGGWGVVTNTANYYRIMANLMLGDGTNATTLTINKQMLELGSSTFYVMWGKKANSTLTLGTNTSGNYSNSTYILYWNHGSPYTETNGYNAWYGAFNMYNSTFIKRAGGFNDPSLVQSNTFNCYNSTLGGNFWYILPGTAGTMSNVVMEAGGTSIYHYIYSSTMTYNNIILTNTAGIVVGSGNAVLSNIDFGTALILGISNANVVGYARNCTFSGSYDAQTRANQTGCQAIIQYTLELDVRDSSNTAIASPTVTIVNGAGTTVFNGTWTTSQNLTVFNKTFGTPSAVTTAFDPFTITISKTGYETYTGKITLTNTTRKMTVNLLPIKRVRRSYDSQDTYLALSPARGSRSKLMQI